jgi:hypothetical protein
VRELASIETNVSRGAPWALDREQGLLREFSRLMREDALASGRELREDRRELWNDLRDDRDEGRRDLGGDGDVHPYFKNDRPAPPSPPELRGYGPDDRGEIQDRPDDRSAPPDLDREDQDRTTPEDEEDAL